MNRRRFLSETQNGNVPLIAYCFSNEFSAVYRGPFASSLLDIDSASLEQGKHDSFLIVRVMDRGTLEDVKLVWEYYGSDKVCEALLEAPALGKKTLSFFANQFALPLEAFRAFRHQGTLWKS